VWYLPLLIPDTDKGPHSITLGHHLQNWPFPFLAQVVADNGGAGFAGTQAIGHPAFAPGVPCDLVLVPAMFTSNLLSAAFWDDPAIPRKSDHFFYRSSLFRSRTPNNPGSFIDFNRNPIVLDQGLLDERLMRGPLHEVEQEMIRDWNLRENRE
jgi:hypothetical protein